MSGDGCIVDVEKKQEFYDSWLHSMKSKILESSTESESFFNGHGIFIPRVGKNVSVGYEDYYNPKIVSIGPYHHGNSQLQAIEGYKAKCLKDLLDRNSTPLEKCTEAVRDKEALARKCYQATIKLSVLEFVGIMVVDAGFIIELLMKQSEDRHPSMFFSIYPLIQRDMLLLENQLPFFILRCLFDLTITQNSPGLNEIAIDFFNYHGQRKGVLPPADSVHHLLHLYQSQFIPDTSFLNPGPISSIPCAAKLHVMGVEFERSSPKSLLTDVKFKEKAVVMKVPHLFIAEDTIALFFNLITLEQSNISLGTHFTSYAVFMSYILSDAEDVEFLCEKGIIEHRLANHKEVVYLFRHMCSGVFIDPHFSTLSAVLRDVKHYSADNWAILKRRLTRGPWWRNIFKDWVTIAVSLVGGVGIWILTFLQTFYTVYTHYR